MANAGLATRHLAALSPGRRSHAGWGFSLSGGRNMNVKDLIELLRALPKGSKIALQRKEFEALFRDSDPGRRAGQIARLNGCDLTVDEESEVATFTRVN